MRIFVSIASLAVLGASLIAPASAGSAVRSDENALRAPHDIAPVTAPYAPTEFLKRRGAFYMGPSHFHSMTIDIQTPMRNPDGLRAYAHASNTPGSLYYRRWLDPQQIADAFATPVHEYERYAHYFRKNGLVVGEWQTRNLLTITGGEPELERALGTTFGRFGIRDRFSHRYTYFDAPLSDPKPGIDLQTIGLSRLVNLQVKHTDYMITSPPQPISSGFSNARVNGATQSQLSVAYDYVGAYKAGYTGKGINIGIIGTGPISANDVPMYRKLYKVPGTSTVTIIPATVNGDTTPPPVTGPCPATALGSISPIGDPTAGSSTSPTAGCNPEDIEAQLDTEQTSMLAYDASVRFYLAYNANGCFIEENPITGGCIGPDSTSQGLDLTDDELMTAANDNKADILSLSYGGCEVLETGLMSVTVNPGGDATGTDPTLFQMLATEGIAVFVSSGDSGSAGCQRAAGGSDAPNLEYPASDPNVVAVGGTTTPMGPDGRLVGPITTWGQQTESGGAEGAGTSIDFQTPSFQSGALAACTMRCVPDVVLDADPYTGAAVVYNTGLSGGNMEVPVGGTSQAAPDMAAMWALVLSACKVTPKCGGGYGNHVVDPTPPYGTPSNASPSYRLGNPNFLWYSLATKASTYGTTANPFYDIVYGNDAVPPYAAQVAASEAGGEGAEISAYAGGTDPGSVNAGPGFDEATGLGAPFARSLITFIVGV